ncbi:polyprenyl diphosphate synthase [Amycolatopsis sp. QT-25]|uniref:polyprenyl diphosphate synthase n=1 Tax=Amycolatopsis sp. QT-25 TaxID=3034022 RepID=UPI0023EC96DA|nr:polyprenyl diphosphate synthase [Amycolatopsis sp. QT-25]WET79022.1 polyprenyl diphosphate synthase [Amycolatopsis sp. QT-25]
MDQQLSLAGIGTPDLHESFLLCERELRDDLAPMVVAVSLLPAQIRPHVHAVSAFAARTDHLADEIGTAGGAHDLERWCADSLEELRAGHSEHPLRRAFVHTVRMWHLDMELIEELLEALSADSAAPPAFFTFADLRRYLRGVSGTTAELLTPLLEPTADDLVLPQRLMSTLGEVFQLVDILQDFPIDLSRGRCYLPTRDLHQLGLSHDDLRAREHRSALNELVELQVRRTRELLEQGAAVVPLVHPSSHPFLQTCIRGTHAYLDEVQRRKSAVLRERIPLPKAVSSLALSEVLLSPHPAASRSSKPRLLRRYFTRQRSPRPVNTVMAPNHIAVIMDGNRRWAAARGRPPVDGHRAGELALQRLIDSALELEIPHVSVFAFSTENWGRASTELDALMELFFGLVQRNLDRYHELGVRVRWCGRRDRVPTRLREESEAAERLTAGNRRLSFTACLDYGGRAEMLDAARALATDAATGLVRPEEIGEDDLVRQFYLPDLPDVDLLIRTSGEQRTSNFLPWHTAYAELVFTDVLWPDFDRRHLLDAIAEYSRRRRRFGADQPSTVATT